MDQHHQADLEQRVRAAIEDPMNMGELPGADAVGTVGNPDCGEIMRLWVKFKHEHGRRVIDRATFQSFGCETAIAVASLATELIRGKTAQEALALGSERLAGGLGPLPPMRLHCAQLVEGALRSALESAGDDRAGGAPASAPSAATGGGAVSQPAAIPAGAAAATLLERFTPAERPPGGRRMVFLEPEDSGPASTSTSATADPAT
jgi:NifU-like protein involved in Fe-S cluster formation